MGKHKHQFFRAPRDLPKVAKPPHIVVSVLAGRERQNWHVPELTTELIRMAFGTASGRYKFTWAPMNNVHPVSAARNRLCEYLLEKTDGDWLVMFDNDIHPPENVLDVILHAPADAAVILLPYWVWNPEKLLPLPCLGRWEADAQGKKQMVTQDYAGRDYHEIGAGGTGAIFIRRSTLEKLPRPWFKIIYDDFEGQVMSEDIYFTSNVTEAGLKIYTHTGYICGHYRSMDLAEINAGMVGTIRAGFEQVRKQYGDLGVTVPTLNELREIEVKHGVWRMDELGNWTCPNCHEIWANESEPTCKCK
jgi:hypothetical protein